MIPLMLKSLAQTLLVVFIVSILVFLFIRAVPGDPARIYAGADAGPEAVQAVRDRLGLNDALPVQYGHWFTNALQLDFGQSYVSGRPVASMVGRAALSTLELTIAAAIFAIVTGMGMGIAAAVKPRSLVDGLAQMLNIIALSIPSFWFGIVLIIIFSLTLGILPPGGRISPLEDPGLWLATLALPMVALGMRISAIISRFTRNGLLEVFRADFIRTAESKGLPFRRILWKHSLRNGLAPVVTVFGIEMGRLIGGSIVIEAVFSWPGLGRLLLHSLNNRDYLVIQAILLFMVVAFVLVSTLTDLTYAWLDPRVRSGARRRGG